ncbi:MAG: histidine--tRNA ligase [Candidatus Omnitrophica bacterium]|nr:histidine--tRNA ligase [Candidatus Omnitrophota bacterium]
MHFQRLRGFPDIVGEEAPLFAKAEAVAREVFPLFGFREIRTPLLEEKGLFTHALGTQTDVVQKEMYEFEDRSKTRVVLRPEGTAGVVRAYIENHFQKNEGLSKFFYLGPMFRSERPQAGRLRQFHQVGVETLGSSSPCADAETIQALVAFLDRMGVDGYEIRLNHLGTFEERGHLRTALKEYFHSHLGDLCEDCQNRVEKNVFRVLDCKRPACRKIIEKSPPIAGYLSPESKDVFKKVEDALSACGIGYRVDPYMVRGLDYYTQTVFEVSHPKLGAQDALAAGGRYDHLIESLGGMPAGAVGFAAGVERLLMSLPSGSEEISGASFFVATLGEEALKAGFGLLWKLRREGVKAVMDFEAKSLKSQLRAADKEKSRYVVILGENELKRESLVLKDMQNGAQEEISLDKAVECLKGKAK